MTEIQENRCGRGVPWCTELYFAKFKSVGHVHRVWIASTGKKTRHFPKQFGELFDRQQIDH